MLNAPSKSEKRRTDRSTVATLNEGSDSRKEGEIPRVRSLRQGQVATVVMDRVRDLSET